MKKILSLLAALVFTQAQAKELDKYDCGQHYCRIPGNKSSGIFRDVLIKKIFDERAFKSGAGADYEFSFPQENQEFTSFQGQMNFAELRSFFPIFKTQSKGNSLTYLDSGATAQMPQSVIDEIVAYYATYKSNVGRGMYEFAEHATSKFEEARVKVARFIGAKKEEIVFTSGATASINLAAHIWADCHIGAGDEIIVSEVEHNANFIPWQQLALKKGAVLKRVPLSDKGVVEVETLKQYLCKKTKLVAITQQSNILGTISDIAGIVSAAHAVGAKVLVDGAQSIVHRKIDVKALDCDFFAFSAHKLFGPTGVGVLYIKQAIFDQCQLCNFGGGMVYSVSPEVTEFKGMPHRLEPGTQPIAQVIGLGAAIDFIEKNINFEQAQEHETALVLKLATALQEIPGVTIISPVPGLGEHNSMVTFTSDTIHAYDIAEYLSERNVAVRAGFHCAQLYHDKLGGNATVRASFTFYNTFDEVDFLIECLKKLLLV
ncbi:MAG: cysteine desulfurase [Candidatus Dependentiae bacterium]|nr:cysteine desulfurase [Candidatus Dependentiae bacterium]